MGEGVLLLIWTVVDRRCGAERKERMEGEAEIEKKKADVTWAQSRDRSDA